MDAIDVRRPHGLSPRQAHAVLQAIADELSDRYGAGYRWDGDTLRFSRFGLRGFVELTPGCARVRVELGLLFMSSKARLEQRIIQFLESPPTNAEAKAVRASVRALLSVSSQDRPAPRPARKPRKTTDPVAASIPSQSAAPGVLPTTARHRPPDEDLGS